MPWCVPGASFDGISGFSIETYFLLILPASILSSLCAAGKLESTA